MNKKMFDQLARSMAEAVAISRGEMKPGHTVRVDPPDAKAVRAKTGLSQAVFARMIGVNVRTLQNWEQHRRTPAGPAAALLTIVDHNPKLAIKALHP